MQVPREPIPGTREQAAADLPMSTAPQLGLPGQSCSLPAWLPLVELVVAQKAQEASQFLFW